jgi:hypothetical protein
MEVKMATRKTELPGLEPDPLDPQPDEVERYVQALQGLGKANLELARRGAWNQIRLAGARSATRPAEAHDTLNRIFRLGSPPEPALEGPYSGILVTPTVARPADSLLRSIASSWMPWLGKRFDPAEQSGDNLFLASASTLTRVLFRYRLEEADGERLSGFRFRTYASPGTVDPDRETLKIDYDSDENPSLLIRNILDELVQVVPGAYLGKVLLRRGSDRWRLVGYFGLEPPVRAEQPSEEPATAERVPAPAAA